MWRRDHVGQLQRFFDELLRARWAVTAFLASVPLAFFTLSAEAQSELLPAQSAAYFDPDRNGEGIFVELLSEGRAVVYLFTYNPPGTTSDGLTQAWVLGVGEQVEGGVVVNELVMPTGGRFGPAFDPGDVQYSTFGSLSFQFPTCGTNTERGILKVVPEAGNGYEELTSGNYVQLTKLVDCETNERPANYTYSGSWYDPLHLGEGLILEVLEDGRAVVQWFTYDTMGRQMWIQGVGDIDGSVLTVNKLLTYNGSHWGSKFNPGAVTESDFGSLSIEFTGCATAILDYASLAFGSGTLHIERFTELMGINEAGQGCWDY